MATPATPVGSTHNKSTPKVGQVSFEQAGPAADPHSSAGNVATKVGSTHNKSTPKRSQISPDQRMPWQKASTALAASLRKLTPASGVAAGGTACVALGYNMLGVTSVTVGGVATTAFSVISDNECRFTTGAHAAGAVDVVFVKAGANGTATGAFTYV